MAVLPFVRFEGCKLLPEKLDLSQTQRGSAIQTGGETLEAVGAVSKSSHDADSPTGSPVLRLFGLKLKQRSRERDSGAQFLFTGALTAGMLNEAAGRVWTVLLRITPASAPYR